MSIAFAYRCCLRASALAAVLVSAHAGVLVVDPIQGPFTDVQSAVDAALSGDTILVKSGTYASFLINSKSLVVVGETGATVTVDGAVRVRSLPAGGLAVLTNLTANGIAGSGTQPLRYGLYLSDNQGAVRVQSCFFQGASGLPSAHEGHAGLYCEISPDVVFTRCGIFGGQGHPGIDNQGTSGAGARLVSSTVAFYDCVLEGGDGAFGHDSFWDGGHGGDGCVADATTLFASNTVSYGGDGGNGVNPGFRWSVGGDGGDGISLLNGATARLLDVVSTGGMGGIGWVGSQPQLHGADGVARSGPPAQFIDIAGVGRELECAPLLRENQLLSLTLTGQPGDHVGLLLSPATNHVFVPNWRGVLCVPVVQPPFVLHLGVIPAGGVLALDLPPVTLPTGVDENVLHLQPLFYDLLQRKRLGSAVSVSILDAAF